MRLILILFSYLLANHAVAANISFTNINPFNGSEHEIESLYIKGKIEPGDYNKLLGVIKNNLLKYLDSPNIILASQGGDVTEALKIARFVKGTYSEVVVGPVTGKCISACFLIYAAAVRRDAGTETIGIHRPYLHPKRLSSLSPTQAENLQNQALSESREYLLKLQVPTNIIDIMFQRASSEVYWLTNKEIHEQIGRRPPWYEQYLIARCGFDKALEKKYFKTADKDLLNYLYRVKDCAATLTRSEAMSFLTKELANKPKPN